MVRIFFLPPVTDLPRSENTILITAVVVRRMDRYPRFRHVFTAVVLGPFGVETREVCPSAPAAAKLPFPSLSDHCVTTRCCWSTVSPYSSCSTLFSHLSYANWGCGEELSLPGYHTSLSQCTPQAASSCSNVLHTGGKYYVSISHLRSCQIPIVKLHHMALSR